MDDAGVVASAAASREKEERTRAAQQTYLEKATITLGYLRTNSFTHHSPFHAIAELADNAYDASADNFYIDYDEKDEVLKFTDDGDGMSPKETRGVYLFGHSTKGRKGDVRIGRYGNGLKSGALYLGRELFMITKQNGVFTVLLISHQFHEDQKFLDSVFVPCPSFDANAVPIEPESEEEKRRLELEVDIIEDYAPLGKRSLREWFQDIKGDKGTIVVISGLQRSVIGELCFNISNPHDFTLEGEKKPWDRSLRKYLEMLYLEPRMKIYLRKKIVVPTRQSLNWMFRSKASFMGRNFCDERELEEKTEEAQRELREEESKLGEMNRRDMSVDRASMMERRKLEESVRVKREQLKINEKAYGLAKKKQDQVFEVRLGLNVIDRDDWGISFYTNNRLVVPCLRDVPFYAKKNPNTIGLSLFIDLNYSVLLPTQNKQGYENKKDFNFLTRSCERQLGLFKKYLTEEGIPKHLYKEWDVYSVDDMSEAEIWETFWKKMGYKNPGSANCVQSRPLDDEQCRVIGSDAGFWRFCETCRGWFEFQTPQPPGRFTCSEASGSGCGRTRNFEKYTVLAAPVKQRFAPPPPPLKQPVPSTSAPVASRDVSLVKKVELRENVDRLQLRVKPDPDEVVETRSDALKSPAGRPVDDFLILDSELDRDAGNMGPIVDVSDTSVEERKSAQKRNEKGNGVPPPVSSSKPLTSSKQNVGVKRSRPDTSRNGRRRVVVDSDSDEEEEQVASKKSEPARKSRKTAATEPQRSTMKDEKWLKTMEKAFNEIILIADLPKLRRGEKIDVAKIVRNLQSKAPANQRVKKTEEVMSDLIEYTMSLPSCRLVVPKYNTIPQVLGRLGNDLKELKKAKKAEKTKK